MNDEGMLTAPMAQWYRTVFDGLTVVLLAGLVLVVLAQAALMALSAWEMHRSLVRKGRAQHRKPN